MTEAEEIFETIQTFRIFSSNKLAQNNVKKPRNVSSPKKAELQFLKPCVRVES